MTEENDSGPPRTPRRPGSNVSRAPAPPPRINYSCTPREPKQQEPKADNDLGHALEQCKGLIRAAREKRKFPRSLWDVERERWPFYREQIDEGLVRCGLLGDPAYQRKIAKLDHEWKVACELRVAAAAALETSDGTAQAAFMQQATGAYPQSVPDVDGKYQVDWDLWRGSNRAFKELSAAVAADYAAVLKQHDEEERRRVIHDWWVKRIERITQRLAAPASLKDRAHICAWDIIEDRTAANPETRTAWLDALAVAVNAGLFNEGTRQQSQLFSFSDAGRVIRWDKKSLATFQQATDVAAHQLKLDRDKYRLQRLESLAKGAWMPRRFIARWLTEYCKLSRLPWWLEDEAPDDLRGELERVHAAYVDVNGKDEWDGFREPCWTHVQTIIWRVTRDPAAVDKASTDSNRPSLGDTYAKCVGAAVIEIWRLNIGEVKDAARELRRLCLAGEMTAYDRSGVPIDKMSWLSLEIVLDNEKMLWIMRDGQPVGDVVFRRDDVLGVWPELHARRAAVQPEAITAIEPAGQDIAEAEDLNAAPGQITVHEALERVARMICTQLGDEWIPELTPKEKWALRPWTNDPSSPVRVLNIADFQPSPDLVARAREKNGWKREQRQRALFWLQDRGLLPATTSLSPTKSTFIDRAAFERIFKAEFGERFGNKVVPPHPSEPDSPTSEPPQDHDGAIDTEPDAELKQAPNAKVREAIRAEYKEAKDKEQKPPNIKELPPLIQNRLKAIGFRASQSNIAKIGGEAEFDKLRIKQGQKWTGRKPD